MTERTNILNETQDDVTRIVYLPTDKLRTFAEHPYKIIDNDEMASLVESIKTQGVLTPIVVRPMENGEYEIVSGHRRVFACRKLGIFEVPAVVRELTREEALKYMIQFAGLKEEAEKLDASISDKLCALLGITLPELNIKAKKGLYFLDFSVYLVYNYNVKV